MTLADRLILKSPAFDGGPGSHSGPVYAVAFTPDGQKLASASWDRTTRFWSADGGFEPFERLEDHRDAVLSLRFSPDGTRMATGSRDGTVLLYDLARLDQPMLLAGHEQKVYSVEFSPDSLLLASGGTDRSVRLWLAGGSFQLRAGPNWRAQLTASYRGDQEVSAVAFLEDTLLASAGNGGDILLRRLEATRMRSRPRLFLSLVVLPRSGQLASTDPRGISLRPLTDFDPRLITVHEMVSPSWALRSLSISPDEKVGLSACLADRICWLDLQNWRSTGFHDFPSEVTSSGFSPDGRWAAVSQRGGPVSIFETSSRRLSTSLTAQGDAFSVAFSPDGALLAVGSYDKQIRLWNTTTWQLVRTLEGHENGVRHVAFAPDGKLLASASWDGTLRLWSVQTHGELARFVSDEGRIWSIVFAPDGKSLYYGGLALHRLEFKALPPPEAALKTALKAGGYRLEGPNLVR